jgi:beta-lactamase class D
MSPNHFSTKAHRTKTPRAPLSILGSLVASVFVAACAAPPTPSAAAPVTPVPMASTAPAAPPAPAADARLVTLPVKARPDLAGAFELEHLKGGIAFFDATTGELSATDPELAKRPFSPAQTFEIAESAIALELGFLDNPDSAMPWDGQYSQNADWNRDHTLRTAVQVSCLPCFQRVAKHVGAGQMQTWVHRLEYGNRDASGPVDRFWLTGKLRITAVEQLDFLRRLDTKRLPITERTLDVVLDVIALDVGASHVLYGKTASSRLTEGDDEFGWFVGFVASEERRVYFATVVTGHAPGVDVAPQRRRATERVLRAIGALPGVPETPAASPS